VPSKFSLNNVELPADAEAVSVEDELTHTEVGDAPTVGVCTTTCRLVELLLLAEQVIVRLNHVVVVILVV